MTTGPRDARRRHFALHSIVVRGTFSKHAPQFSLQRVIAQVKTVQPWSVVFPSRFRGGSSNPGCVSSKRFSAGLAPRPEACLLGEPGFLRTKRLHHFAVVCATGICMARVSCILPLEKAAGLSNIGIMHCQKTRISAS